MKDPWKKYQIVWPKDRRARDGGPDGWFDRLSDITKGKGADMFIAKPGEAIKADRWGNWDSYHSRNHHYDEQRIRHPLWNKARGTKRYDPESRTYQEWAMPSDFHNFGVDGNGRIDPFGEGYAHFTEEEWNRMTPALRKGRRVDPTLMGNDWGQHGPKRFDAKHDYFWQHAHRIGENREYYRNFNPSVNIYDPIDDRFIVATNKNINPLLTMRAPFGTRFLSPQNELANWILQES